MHLALHVCPPLTGQLRLFFKQPLLPHSSKLLGCWLLNLQYNASLLFLFS